MLIIRDFSESRPDESATRYVIEVRGGSLQDGITNLFLAGRIISATHVTASSELKLSEIPANNDWIKLESGWVMLLPLVLGACPAFGFQFSAEAPTKLRVELRRSNKAANFTPDETLEVLERDLPAGESNPQIGFTRRHRHRHLRILAPEAPPPCTNRAPL